MSLPPPPPSKSYQNMEDRPLKSHELMRTSHKCVQVDLENVCIVLQPYVTVISPSMV